MLLLLILTIFGSSVASECSSGDTRYLCENLNTCWSELGFQSQDDLKYLCEIQGYTYDGDDSGDSAPAVEITTKPRNLTIPEGSSAAFRCSADNAVSVIIRKSTQMDDKMRLQGTELHQKPTQQTTIQEIDSARIEHQGWYTCLAHGADGTSVAEEAYLSIRDVCADNACEDPKVCVADQYTATYECLCPGECGNDFDPVCGSDCESYFNECTLKKQTCEKGLSGITVIARGLCSFTPSAPSFTSVPKDSVYQEGEMMSLEALTSGFPAATIVWYANNVKVGDSNQFNSDMKIDFKGRWRVEASICLNKYTSKSEFTVDMEESQAAKEPEEQCCKVYGDPHIITFDQKKFDYMGVGTFIIAMDRVTGQWLVYGGFERCGDKTKQLSCITSVTVFYENQKVQFLRMWRVNNNGQEFSVPLGQSRTIGGIRIDNVNLEYIVSLGDTGVVVKWDGIVTSQVCISKCADNVYGICGDANCDDSNEFDMRGFMNPYTRSWKAESSSEFGNSWAVDPAGSELEPEDGALAESRTRPCKFIPSTDRADIERRCQEVANLEQFDRISETTIDVETALQNCYFDSCAGLVFGMGCDGNGDASCAADIEAMIEEALAQGMSRADAIAKYRKSALDPACMMGMGFARDLKTWGIRVGTSWRTSVTPFCPSDDELENISICPTL